MVRDHLGVVDVGSDFRETNTTDRFRVHLLRFIRDAQDVDRFRPDLVRVTQILDRILVSRSIVCAWRKVGPDGRGGRAAAAGPRRLRSCG